MFGRKKYADDYAEVDDNAIGGTFVPPQKLGRIDYLIALALGVMSMVLFWAMTYSHRGVSPEVWSDCTIAAGLRPAETLAPGYWRLIAKGLFKAFGPNGGLTAIVILGKVFLGSLVALSYLTFKEVLAILVRMIDTDNIWCRVLSRAVCALTAFCFLCADPVWSLGYAFSPALFEAFLFALTAFLLSRFLAGGAVLPAYAAMFSLGLLGAETPLGLIALVGFWLIFYILLTKGGLFHIQLLQPLLQQSSKWYLTFFWAAGLGVGLAANILSFKLCGGMVAGGLTASAVPLRYASQLWHTLVIAASPGAWILGIGATLLPFVLGVSMLRRATDLEYFLPYRVGLVFFFIAAVSYSQMSSAYPLWFWCFNDAIVVRSKLLLFLCMQMTAVAVLCALSVALVDTFCRDHRRLAAQYDPDLDDALPDTHGIAGLYKKSAVFALVSLVLAGGVAYGRYQPKMKALRSLVDDYVDEVVTEADGMKYLFTDGHYDCGFELESWRRGGSLICIAAQPGRYARNGLALIDHMTGAEDKLCAQIGGANILKTWQKDRYERLDNAGIMVGLRLWPQFSDRSYPSLSGVMARTSWPSQTDEAVVAGVARGQALMERILAFYGEKNGQIPAYIGRELSDDLLFMQWRLSRLARVRSEVYDRLDDRAAAEFNYRMAEKLDDANASLKRLQEEQIKHNEWLMGQMTPRQGLALALIRADFPLAHRFADVILQEEPSHCDSNFAIGMDYLVQEQYTRAEPYLNACLTVRDKEPAIWNNIAVLQFRQGRYEEALENVKKALELAPNNEEVKRTMKQILQKMESDVDPEEEPEVDEPAPAAEPPAPVEDVPTAA